VDAFMVQGKSYNQIPLLNPYSGGQVISDFIQSEVIVFLRDNRDISQLAVEYRIIPVE